jgi:hypothetical protein
MPAFASVRSPTILRIELILRILWLTAEWVVHNMAAWSASPISVERFRRSSRPSQSGRVLLSQVNVAGAKKSFPAPASRPLQHN